MSTWDDLRDRIAAVLHRHWVSEPSGGTATEAWCDCTCGARIAVPGGTRDEASRRGDEHQADAVKAALLSEGAFERAARACFDIRDDAYDDREWGELDSQERELYLCQARAALTAAIEGEDEK